MKATKFFAIALAAVAFASFTTSCEKKDEPKGDDPVIVTPDDDVTPDESDLTVKEGFYTIAFQPAKGTVCNDIYFVGNYAESAWALDGANLKFEALAGFEGWYVVYVPDNATNDAGEHVALQGKPMQAKADGSLSWDFQTGDKDSWTVEAGDVTIEAGYAGESNLTYNDPSKPVIFKSSSWKNGKTPCVVAETFDFVITVIFPEGVPSVGVEAMGSFDGWSTGVALTLVEGNKFTCTINAEADAEFKFREAGNWENEVEGYNAEADEWKGLANMKFADVADDAHAIALDYSDATLYRWKAAAAEAVVE